MVTGNLNDSSENQVIKENANDSIMNHQIIKPAMNEQPELEPNIKAEVKNLNFYYGNVHALKGINFNIPENQITALIGPSGCGKTTLLRCFNRMHELYPNTKYKGSIIIHGEDILGKNIDPIEVRMRISMVFQRPNPFPKSIYENVAYGLRVIGEKRRNVLDEKIEKALRDAALWDEV
ncbi:MAG TPA: ATP-binding cassette domain-containing protein, partial [Allocoleopsis sp.]